MPSVMGGIRPYAPHHRSKMGLFSCDRGPRSTVVSPVTHAALKSVANAVANAVCCTKEGLYISGSLVGFQSNLEVASRCQLPKGAPRGGVATIHRR